MIDFAKRGGTIPVVVQSVVDATVLMLGYANAAALEKSLATGYATFWSTSRNELWTKGETSGDLLRVEEIRVDCDQDALLYRVTPLGAGACHTREPNDGAARKSCFYRAFDGIERLGPVG
ncbi:MAG: phosphoribosyl-AMP cyclohydrolase [Nitrospinae bacterium]|nr:phosphoribosyl-AMP cyclohydrolase [Nitrospinota bacterium]